MRLYPAIDLLGGRAVRLERGERDKATVYHERPVELVAQLARGGADRLHVVDLDGAFAGAPQQTALIAGIIAASPVPVEVGGGIRDRAGIDALLALGAAYVVLGTAAVRSPALVEDACRAHPGKVIASGGVGSLDDLRRLRAAGIASVVVGKAIYDRRFTVEEAAEACRTDGPSPRVREPRGPEGAGP